MAQLRVTASSLKVREAPSLQAGIVGALAQNDIVDQGDISEDRKWVYIQKSGLVGWSSQRYLTPYLPGATKGPLDQIIEIAGSSAISTYGWHGRGIAPAGYIKGVALVFARVYCKLLTGDQFAVEMGKANTGDSAKDALSHYASQFEEHGMDNEAAGVTTLRHLFVLLLGLGMRESSGRYCEGRDMSAENTTSETAEAGLFQTSWNARSASPLLPEIFAAYRANPSGFVDVFQEGVAVRPRDLENYGSGDGEEFQRLSKACPAFAAEFAAVGLRNIRKHWGPINTRAAELRPEADRMFLRVQQAVDTFDLCSTVR